MARIKRLEAAATGDDGHHTGAHDQRGEDQGNRHPQP
jgi:hypothetical protein